MAMSRNAASAARALGPGLAAFPQASDSCAARATAKARRLGTRDAAPVPGVFAATPDRQVDRPDRIGQTTRAGLIQPFSILDQREPWTAALVAVWHA